MNKPTVLLCGPIGGRTVAEANAWRKNVAFQFSKVNIIGISPLRAEPKPELGFKYDVSFGVVTTDTHKSVYSKNKFDINRADMLLFYLPRVLNDYLPSYGTVWELGYAHALGKPIVLVSDDPRILGHPDLRCCADWIVQNLDEGVKTCIDMLDGFNGGVAV